jgi:hypothetical protein
LDDYSDSDVEQTEGDPEIVISSAALSHIKDNTTKALNAKRPGMALVLYKPIAPFVREPECDEPRIADCVQSEDDAMDVGP